MERERLIGIALVDHLCVRLRQRPLFAKPAYAAGVDWLTLLAWRFLFAADRVVGVAADLAQPTRALCATCRDAACSS